MLVMLRQRSDVTIHQDEKVARLSYRFEAEVPEELQAIYKVFSPQAFEYLAPSLSTRSLASEKGGRAP
jgi:hypothetical protein